MLVTIYQWRNAHRVCLGRHEPAAMPRASRRVYKSIATAKARETDPSVRASLALFTDARPVKARVPSRVPHPVREMSFALEMPTRYTLAELFGLRGAA